MIETLYYSQSIRDELLAHALDILPNECCGYISGVGNKLKKVFKLTNLDAKHDHFTMDPKEQFAAMKEARRLGQDLKVVYHSHPETPARPSEEDKRLLQDPNMIYIIISCEKTEPDIKAFKIVNKEVTTVNLVLSEDFKEGK